VARVCLEALETEDSVGQIIEITSDPAQAGSTLGQWLARA
jgi:hypothetical protein